ncbi:MAG: hypothetical protein EZS28_032238, partial [Streblomastix strix]
ALKFHRKFFTLAMSENGDQISASFPIILPILIDHFAAVFDRVTKITNSNSNYGQDNQQGGDLEVSKDDLRLLRYAANAIQGNKEASNLLHLLNGVMLRALEFTDRTIAFRVLFEMLRDAAPQSSPIDIADQIQQNQLHQSLGVIERWNIPQQKIANLVIRCLQKLLKTPQESFAELRYDEIVPIIDNYLYSVFAGAKIKGMDNQLLTGSIQQDVPWMQHLRLMKTALYKLVEMSSNKGINVILGLPGRNQENAPFSLAVVRGMIRSIYGNGALIQTDEVIRNCGWSAALNAIIEADQIREIQRNTNKMNINVINNNLNQDNQLINTLSGRTFALGDIIPITQSITDAIAAEMKDQPMQQRQNSNFQLQSGLGSSQLGSNPISSTSALSDKFSQLSASIKKGGIQPIQNQHSDSQIRPYSPQTQLPSSSSFNPLIRSQSPYISISQSQTPQFSVNSSISPPQSLQSIETGSVSQIPIFLDISDAAQIYRRNTTEEEELRLNGIFADAGQPITTHVAQKQLYQLLLNQPLIDWQGLLKKQSATGEKMCSFLSRKLSGLFDEDVKNGKINANDLTLAGIDAKTSANAEMNDNGQRKRNRKSLMEKDDE